MLSPLGFGDRGNRHAVRAAFVEQIDVGTGLDPCADGIGLLCEDRYMQWRTPIAIAGCTICAYLRLLDDHG